MCHLESRWPQLANLVKDGSVFDFVFFLFRPIICWSWTAGDSKIDSNKPARRTQPFKLVKNASHHFNSWLSICVLLFQNCLCFRMITRTQWLSFSIRPACPFTATQRTSFDLPRNISLNPHKTLQHINFKTITQPRGRNLRELLLLLKSLARWKFPTCYGTNVGGHCRDTRGGIRSWNA